MVRRAENALDVDSPMCGRLRGIVDHGLAEVARGPQRARGSCPHLSEVSEVGELVQLGECLYGVGGQRDIVPLGHVKKRCGSYSAFQVNVQLDLRERHASIMTAPGPAGRAALAMSQPFPRRARLPMTKGPRSSVSSCGAWRRSPQLWLTLKEALSPPLTAAVLPGSAEPRRIGPGLNSRRHGVIFQPPPTLRAPGVRQGTRRAGRSDGDVVEPDSSAGGSCAGLS